MSAKALGMAGRATNIVVGIWLMASPAVLAYGGSIADAQRVIGPVIVSIATIAIWESTRALRWVNVLSGAALIGSALILGAAGPALMNSLICGVLVIGAALLRGTVDERFGGGWRGLFQRV